MVKRTPGPIPTPVRAVNLESDKVTHYPSSARAARAFNIAQSNVLAVLGGKRESIKGHVFEWAGEKPEAHGRVKQPIVATHETGTKRSFESIQAAAKELNVSQSNISAVLGGRMKTTKKYSFKRDGGYIKMDKEASSSKKVKTSKKPKKVEKEEDSDDEEEEEEEVEKKEKKKPKEEKKEEKKRKSSKKE
eukprot:Platyproteum_vivax@DN3165_c0_g1_i2.p1